MYLRCQGAHPALRTARTAEELRVFRQTENTRYVSALTPLFIRCCNTNPLHALALGAVVDDGPGLRVQRHLRRGDRFHATRPSEPSGCSASAASAPPFESTSTSTSVGKAQSTASEAAKPATRGLHLFGGLVYRTTDRPHVQWNLRRRLSQCKPKRPELRDRNLQLRPGRRGLWVPALHRNVWPQTGIHRRGHVRRWAH